VGEPTHLVGGAAVKRGCGSLVFGSPRGGLLEHLERKAVLRAKIPQIYDIQYNAGAGDAVEPFHHSGNQLGVVCFDCDGLSAYRRLRGQVLQALGLRVRGLKR